MTDDELLLDLLNSTPVVDGAPTDRLADPIEARLWLAKHDGEEAELSHVRQARAQLKDVVRGRAPSTTLAGLLRGVSRTPRLSETGLDWELAVAPTRRTAVRAVLAWAELAERAPGRLRPCANEECQLFLIDRSKANTARWCSMASCGNRLKARRHQARTKG